MTIPEGRGVASGMLPISYDLIETFSTLPPVRSHCSFNRFVFLFRLRCGTTDIVPFVEVFVKMESFSDLEDGPKVQTLYKAKATV